MVPKDVLETFVSVIPSTSLKETARLMRELKRLSLDALTIAHGSAATGGGIGNAGILSLANSTFLNNHATSQGGAIYNTGTLTVTNSIGPCNFINHSSARRINYA